DKAASIVEPSDLATIIYTSGTTGPPKGVMIDHQNVCFTVESMRRSWEIDLAGKRILSYLPMAHIAERMVSHYQSAILGTEVTACPDPGLVAKYLPEVRPELFFAVPRVWEKIYGSVQSMIASNEEKKQQLDFAVGIGWQVSELHARGEQPTGELAATFAKVEPALTNLRATIGLDQCLSAITGAAPIPVGVFRFFRGLGVPLSEIYGLSETCGPMTWTPVQIKVGTVGPAIPGCEVKLAADGEVVCRGGNVFRGYLNDPEKTAEAIVDGWFQSGDIGVFDEDGYLKIVDRKKELIITAGGKNISPANIEAALKADPLVGQVCVIGDQRPYLVALMVLDPEVAPAWASKRGIEATGLEDLAQNAEVRAEVQRGVDEANKQFARVEQIKKFTLLPHEWLPDSEELTPTMKLKRRGIHARYAEEIEALYR
ncbi:MAG: AMP-dependent synthetase/ligase, partial [Acidimicrobiia bacterium]